LETHRTSAIQPGLFDWVMPDCDSKANLYTILEKADPINPQPTDNDSAPFVWKIDG